MNGREELLKQIVKVLASWKAEIELRGDINLYDSHIIAQHHIRYLLNWAYGYALEDLNYDVRNQVGIDLGDYKNRIAVQVTATKKRAKIEDTIRKFIDNRLYERFHELYFFILSAKQHRYKEFDTKGLLIFDSRKHILDLGDLIQRINALETSQLSGIINFLQQEASLSEQVNQRDLQIVLKYFPETGLGTSLLVKLTNPGQRPVTVQDVFLNLKSGGKVGYGELRYRHIQLSTPLPYKLTETEFCEFLFPLYYMNELKGNEFTSPLDVTSVEILDSQDQIYRFPSDTPAAQIDFVTLLEEIREDWVKSDWLTKKA